MTKPKKNESNVTIYSNSCTTCGTNAVYVARVKRQYRDVTVINSRADKSKLIEHIEYQKLAGMESTPVPIVVENGGEVITLLKEWK